MEALNWDFPYHSQRMPVFAQNVVATSQPLAAQTGLQMLHKGGNAVDAAIAAAIALTVVEPTSNGIGSDAFAMVWDGKQLHGVNGSGRSPTAWNFDDFAKYETMPLVGWDAVTVPGAVSLWALLSERFGKLPFDVLCEPAIGYARDGFLVSPKTAQRWLLGPELYPGFQEFAATFLPFGRAPRTGEYFRCPDQATTLEEIARTRGESFYRGRLAELIVSQSHRQGGKLSLDDLADHQAEWVSPIAQSFNDVEVHELPPNTQGLAALQMLGILNHTHLVEHPVDSADSIHLQLEAMKLAFADLTYYVGDPDTMAVSDADLSDPSYLAARAAQIDRHRAQTPKWGIPADQGTVYLTSADTNGMMVSFIQSNYHGFGSGVVIKDTGISLQNRGAGFSLEAGHPNQVAGAKRPLHTIIPGFVTKNGHPLVSFGVMGAAMQPQGHVQMMIRMFVYGQNPQTASDAPRWCLTEDGQVALEPGFAPDVLDDLKGRGHRLVLDAPEFVYGGAQLIGRLPEGFVAASDHRKDGQAVGF